LAVTAYFTCTVQFAMVILALRCRECGFATRLVVQFRDRREPALPGAAAFW